MFTGVCLSHEGTEELEALCKELKAQNKLMWKKVNYERRNFRFYIR
jgi:hypothetical protein